MVKTRLAYPVFKNKTEAEGGKNEARTEEGENKALSGGLVDKTRLANNVLKKYQDRNGTDRHKPLYSGLVDKIRLGFNYHVSKNKKGIGTDKLMFGGHEDKTQHDNSVFKNKTEAKGGKNEARTEDGENKAQSSRLVDKTRLANNVFKTKAKGGKNEARTEDGENKALSDGLMDKTRPTYGQTTRLLELLRAAKKH